MSSRELAWSPALHNTVLPRCTHVAYGSSPTQPHAASLAVTTQLKTPSTACLLKVCRCSLPKKPTTLHRTTIARLLPSIRRIPLSSLTLPHSHILLKLILILVIKRQLSTRRNISHSEERDVVNSRIVLVVADRILTTVRFATVVDESCWPAHVLSIHDIAVVRGEVVFVDEFVQTVEVALLVFRACLLSAVGFLVRDDLAKVGIDELSLDQVLIAADSPAPVWSFEDREWYFATLLNDSTLAASTTLAVRIALVDGKAFFSVE